MLVKVANDLSRAHVDSVDAEIEHALQVLGRRLELEIVSLLVLEDNARLVTRHEWRTLGWMDPPLEIDTSQASWWMARRTAGEDVVIHDVDELGVDALHERLMLTQRGTRSLLAIALSAGARSDGYLVLERHSAAQRWGASDIDIASAFADAIAAAMDRRDQHRALVDAAARAEAASHERANFLAMLAHELRGPLTAIIGHAQLLAAEAAPPSSTARRAGHILACATHVVSVAEDALDLARIDAGRLSVSASDLDVRDVVAAAVAAVEPLAEEHGVTVVPEVPDAPVSAHADRRRLHQIVFNLLENAVKFNEPGGKVTLRLHQGDSRYEIEVEDTGAGIAPRDRARIFESFARARDSEQGVGIGLALVRRLCTLQGGEVTVEDSEPGSGALFRVVLPDVPPAPAPSRSPYVGAV